MTAFNLPLSWKHKEFNPHEFAHPFRNPKVLSEFPFGTEKKKKRDTLVSDLSVAVRVKEST